MRAFVSVVALFAIFGLGLALSDAAGGEKKIPLDKLPKKIVDSVKKRFPKAEMVAASMETVDKTTTYEIILKNDGKQIDVTLSAEGVIEGMEKEITIKDLPKAVTKVLTKNFPKATYKKFEEVIKVKDGKEVFEFYEVLLDTADKKTVEVKIEANGRVISPELPGQDKKDEKKSGGKPGRAFTDDFSIEKADLVSTGRNPYFILEPGFQRILEGGGERFVNTVLFETKMVDGIETRIVEEREFKDGKVVEVSLNYYAISKRTNNVYYFGEHVDIYKNEKIVSHEGSWLSGVKKARFGLMMMGMPLLGARYHQEVAPGDAMDRAEIVSVSETIKTPAGEFKNCLKIEETTPLEPANIGYKYYAPGIGMIRDGNAKLVSYGMVKK